LYPAYKYWSSKIYKNKKNTKTQIEVTIKLMKGKPSGSIACTRKQQPRFY